MEDECKKTLFQIKNEVVEIHERVDSLEAWRGYAEAKLETMVFRISESIGSAIRQHEGSEDIKYKEFSKLICLNIEQNLAAQQAMTQTNEKLLTTIDQARDIILNVEKNRKWLVYSLILSTSINLFVYLTLLILK